MNTEHSELTERDEQLGAIVFAWLRAVEQGNAAEPHEVLARHPEFTSELRDFFAEREKIDQVLGDLAKQAAIRMAWAHAKDLARYGASAVAITPGWMRSEQMLDNYRVTEANWRDAIAIQPHFAITETPRNSGCMAISSLPRRHWRILGRRR